MSFCCSFQIKDSSGDGFYIRALFDRLVSPDATPTTGSNDRGGGGGGGGAGGGDETVEALSFKKDDVLFVDNTLHGGLLGTWHAW